MCSSDLTEDLRPKWKINAKKNYYIGQCILNDIGISNIECVKVIHCPQAYGLVLTLCPLLKTDTDENIQVETIRKSNTATETETETEIEIEIIKKTEEEESTPYRSHPGPIPVNSSPPTKHIFQNSVIENMMPISSSTFSSDMSENMIF